MSKIDLSGVDEILESKELDLSGVDDILSSSDKPYEAPSQVEAALRGAAQGASLGFSDEATAALESMLTQKSYEEALRESRAAYKASEEEHPATSFLANLVGGFAVPVPGLGAGKALAKGASVATKAKEFAKLGAKAGALAAAGTSEESLTESPRHLAHDIVSGATTGAVATPILGLLAPAIAKKASDAWGSTEFVQDAKKLFKHAAQTAKSTGENVMTREYSDKLNKELAEDVQGFVSAIKGRGTPEDLTRGKQLLGAPTLKETKDTAYKAAEVAAEGKFASLNKLDDMIAAFEKELSPSELKVQDTVDNLNRIKGVGERVKNVIMEEVPMGNNLKELEAAAMKKLNLDITKTALKSNPMVEQSAKTEAMKIASRAINSSESAITDISENWASKTRARLLAEAENIFGEDPDILFDVKNGINAIEAKHIREIDPNTGREVLTSIMKNPFGEGNLINTTVIDNIEAFKGLKPKTPEWNKALENLTESIIEEKAGKINLNPKINKMELPDGKIAIQGTWQDANGKVISKEHILNPEMQYMKVPTVTKNSADIKQLREMSADLESIISGNQDYRTKKLAMDMKQEVNGQIDKLSNQLEQKARDLQVAKTDIQALLGINLDTNNPLAFKSEFENITTALKNKLIDKFDQESNDVRRRISEAFQKMYDAGFIDQEGFNRLHNELGGRAKIANILKHSHETSNLATNLLNFTKWPQTARGTGYSVAGHSGVVAGSASKLAGEMMQSLSHATPEQLKTLALGLKQAGSPFAPVIENIVNSPMAKRRAVIFTLMQNKDFKSMVSGIADAAIDVEKDNKEK